MLRVKRSKPINKLENKSWKKYGYYPKKFKRRNLENNRNVELKWKLRKR